MINAATKALPISFTDAMRLAVVERRKTQTRRVIKCQDRLRAGVNCLGEPGPEYRNEYGSWQPWVPNAKTLRCPFGVPGDRLYVGQPHRLFCDTPGEVRVVYEPTGYERGFALEDLPAETAGRLRAYHNWGHLRQSRFMFRALADIWLEITDVRVQRVRSINARDCYAEGCPWPTIEETGASPGGMVSATDNKAARAQQVVDWFHDLWDSLNAKRGFGWDVDPCVWAITFRLLPSQLKGDA